MRTWLCLIAFTAAAQVSSTTGALQGVVLDPQRSPVAGAEIRATHEETGATRQAVSRADGSYALGFLPIGPYTIHVKAAGFAPREIKEALVSVGQTVVQPFDLTLASVAEKMEVVEQGEMLQANATSASLAMGYERVEHGTSQSRGYLNFVLTAPGIVPAAGSSAGRSPASTWNLANDSGFSAAGMRSRNNSITIDGSDNRDETTGAPRVAVPVEMIQELRVAGQAVSADFGGAAGGIVNIVTRSGGNDWHGHAEFMAQHENLNARNPEFAIDGRPHLRRMTPGGSGGGPIHKDRTFFAAAIEGWHENCDEWSESPFTAPGLTRGVFRAGERDLGASAKMQHLINTRHSFTARYAYSWGRVNRGVQGIEDFSDLSARGSSLQRDHSFVAGLTSVFTPQSVSSLTVQVASRTSRITPNSTGLMTQIPGVITFGQGYKMNQQRDEDHYQVTEALNVTKGRHSLSLGADVHAVRFDGSLANRFAGIAVQPSLNAAPVMRWLATGQPATRYNTYPLGFWLNDRIQLRPGLTMEAGVRYDRQAMPSPIPADNTNVAPRWGIAWSPSSAWVLRAGAGLFYDRYPLAFLNDALQKDGTRAIESFNGAPGRYAASRDFPTTYSARVTAGAERLLNRDTSLSFEYSFLRGLHLPRTRQIGSATAPLWQIEQTAQSRYQGLSIALHRRMTREFGYMLGYTGGVASDDGSDFDEQPSNPANIRADWGRSRLHQAHRVTGSALFEIPWFEEWSEKLEHIHFVPTFTYGSARPLNTLAGISSLALQTAAYPLSARPSGVGRNTARTPANASFDMRLFKELHLGAETRRLQLGAEGYNLFNRANPIRLNAFAHVQGAVIEFAAARQIQLFAHFEF